MNYQSLEREDQKYTIGNQMSESFICIVQVCMKWLYFLMLKSLHTIAFLLCMYNVRCTYMMNRVCPGFVEKMCHFSIHV